MSVRFRGNKINVKFIMYGKEELYSKNEKISINVIISL